MSEQTTPQSIEDQELSAEELEDVAGGGTTINNGCNIGCQNP